MWLEDDTEAVLEWQREQALLCPDCGQPRDKTMSEDARTYYRSRVMTCRGCEAIDRKRRQFSSGDHEDAGVKFTIEEVED